MFLQNPANLLSIHPVDSNLVLKRIANAGFYAENEDKGFGMMYRGWGGFVYNASEGASVSL